MSKSSVQSVLILIGASALAIACSSSNGAPPPAATPATQETPAEPTVQAIPVGAALVRVEAVSALYATSATLRAEKTATVTTRAGGVVERLLVEEGDDVSDGQELAILENDEQKIEASRAETSYATKKRELERARRLHEQGMLSEEAFEALRREAEELRHGAELADLQLERTVIRAPFAGRVVVRHLDPGTTVASGTAVVDIADLVPLFADVNVPEREIPRLRPGQSVRVSRDDVTALRVDARIERIAPSVEASTGTVKVTLAVPPRPELRPGSFVRVQIVTETHAEALVVPRSALVADGRRWHVYRVGADGEHVERLEIERGFEEGERVEVAGTVEGSPPLSAEDRIVINGASALSDGARISVVDQVSELRASLGGGPRVAP